MVEPKARFAGVDWASEAHHVGVVGDDGSRRAERVFRHGGAGLTEMADCIAAKCGGSAPEDIPVAIEVPHGLVVESTSWTGGSRSTRSTRSSSRGTAFVCRTACGSSCGATTVAPVTRRSGKYKLVVRRMSAHARLRDAVYHWSRVAVRRGPPARGRLRHAPNPDLLPASTPGGGKCGLISSPGAGQRGGPHPRTLYGPPRRQRSPRGSEWARPPASHAGACCCPASPPSRSPDRPGWRSRGRRGAGCRSCATISASWPSSPSAFRLPSTARLISCRSGVSSLAQLSE